jgi:hypothetical protein
MLFRGWCLGGLFTEDDRITQANFGFGEFLLEEFTAGLILPGANPEDRRSTIRNGMVLN